MKPIQHIHFLILAALAVVIAVRVMTDIATLGLFEGPMLLLVAVTGWLHSHRTSRKQA